MNELVKLRLVQLAEKIAKNRMMFCMVAVTEQEKAYLNNEYRMIMVEFDRRELVHESTVAIMKDAF